VTALETKTGANWRPMDYWWICLLDTVLVTAGLLFFLSTRYGTYEFFGTAVAMALLPLIPVLVLVGGAGSTVFALAKRLIEKRGLKRPAALSLLVGPALAVTLPLVLLGAWESPAHRLAYVCAGCAPASASHVRLTGYSTFLSEEWLVVFQTDAKSFQTLAANARLAPVDEFEFQEWLQRSALKKTQLGQNLAPITNALCFKRIFKESEEHERGTIFALFDPATDTAVVLRNYRD
jgi:hypothetical protein